MQMLILVSSQEVTKLIVGPAVLWSAPVDHSLNLSQLLSAAVGASLLINLPLQGLVQFCLVGF
jgi:hypothetical protein